MLPEQEPTAVTTQTQETWHPHPSKLHTKPVTNLFHHAQCIARLCLSKIAALYLQETMNLSTKPDLERPRGQSQRGLFTIAANFDSLQRPLLLPRKLHILSVPCSPILEHCPALHHVILVDERQDHRVHMRFFAGIERVGVGKLESDSVFIRRFKRHLGLVSQHTIMGHK